MPLSDNNVSTTNIQAWNDMESEQDINVSSKDFFFSTEFNHDFF